MPREPKIPKTTLDASGELVEWMFENERALVGGCLIKPANFAFVGSLVSPRDFFHHECADLWRIFLKLDQEGDFLDEASVLAELRRTDAKNPEEILHRLTEGVPAIDVAGAARRVQEGAFRRHSLEMFEKAATALMSRTTDPVERLRSLRESIDALLAGRNGFTRHSASQAEVLSGADLLDKIQNLLRRFVHITEDQSIAISLWIVHTHALEAADVTPYLSISSAEKQSGKTRLLEVLELLVAKPWMTGKVTCAVLARKVDAQAPTLLFDESDATFRGDREFAENFRGILNSGHRRGGRVSACVGKGAEIKPTDFDVFCPKAIAGIGSLPDTVADRSIPIVLKRKAQGEIVGRFRRNQIGPEAERLRTHASNWANAHLLELKSASPQLPDQITDRQQDGAEPLLAIADLAGVEWPHKARTAVVQLFSASAHETSSHGVRLLGDIKDIFESRAVQHISSTELVAALIDIEGSPWGECHKGQPLSTHGLARMLKPYGIYPRNIRIDGETVLKGYSREVFTDTWDRYVPALHGGTPSESTNAHNQHN